MYQFTYFVTEEGYGFGLNTCMVKLEDLEQEIRTCISQGWPFAVREAF